MAERLRPPPKRLGQRIRKRWRPFLRSLHRDVGYLIIGLTVVYAVSGLAVNHIGDDFNPSKKLVEEEHSVDASAIPRDNPRDAARAVLGALSMEGEPERPFLAEGQLDFVLLEEDGTEHVFIVDLESGTVTEEYEESRFFLHVANWLHKNRGKDAWTYIADGYAILLLFLATSGVFMLKGRKGFFGRGMVLILIGSSVPILYVHFSGGPGG